MILILEHATSNKPIYVNSDHIQWFIEVEDGTSIGFPGATKCITVTESPEDILQYLQPKSHHELPGATLL